MITFSENFKHRLNIASIIFAIALAPLTVLILLSQNSVPGDFSYPIKRGMENVVLAGATFSPVTRVAFRTDLTEKRFDEAETLILADNYNLSGFKEFVGQAQAASQEIGALSDSVEKEKLKQKFRNSFAEYKKRTAKIKAKIATNAPVVGESPTPVVQSPLPTNTPVPLPTELPLPTNTPVPLPTTNTPQPQRPTNTPVPRPTSTLRPTNTPVPLPTSTPIAPTPTLRPGASTPTPTRRPTPTLTPTRIPSLTPTPTPKRPPGGGPIIIHNPTIDDWYNCIAEHVGDPDYFCEPPPPLDPSPTPTPTLPPGAPTSTPQPTGTLFGGPSPIFEPVPTLRPGEPTYTPTPTRTPTPIPTSTPIPTPACTPGWDSNNCSSTVSPGRCSDYGNLGYCGWSSFLYSNCVAKCTVTPTPTTVPSCTPGWNSSTCSFGGGPDFSDFGNPSYCFWNPPAWDSCNDRNPVHGAKTYRPPTLWDSIFKTLGIDNWTN